MWWRAFGVTLVMSGLGSIGSWFDLVEVLCDALHSLMFSFGLGLVFHSLPVVFDHSLILVIESQCLVSTFHC